MKRAASGAMQVLVAVPSPRVARRISEALLELRLCACVQTLGPITSRYRWKGSLESAREWLLLIKTTRLRSEAVERQVRKLHPYEVPEILAFEVTSAHPPYLEWLLRETAPARHKGSRGGVASSSS